MSRPFYCDAETAKKRVVLLSHFLFPRDFWGTIADTNIINTQPEPSRATDVPFAGYKAVSKDLRGVLAAKSISACSGAI